MGAFVDLTGQQYGFLTVLYRGQDKICGKRKIVTWVCQCKCGNLITTRSDSLRNGHTKSCGCKQYGNRVINEIGNKYGKLTVIERVGSDSDHKALWKCQCECGGIVITTGKRLRNGTCASCGCVHSVMNSKINQYLKDNNITFKSEYNFKDLLSENGAYLRFDFGILKEEKLIGLIEYNGEQHYLDIGRGYYTKEALDLLHLHDEQKKNYCKEHNIPLLIIKYTDDYEEKIAWWLKEVYYG